MFYFAPILREFLLLLRGEFLLEGHVPAQFAEENDPFGDE
jgi:hypothetical protein